MTDKEALNEFLRGAAIPIGIFVLFILFIAFISTPGITPEWGGVTQVWGWWISIKNCEVIRWTDPSSRWHYFLNCTQSRTNEAANASM